VPAIQTARLRQQSALVAEHFSDPEAYVRSLHYLLDFYSNRAKRPGQSGRPGPLIEAYQVHPPVLRMILQDLVPLARNEPEKGFALCDALWKETHLEFRLLASMLIGQMPVDELEKIIERIQHWITVDLEIQLVDAILTNSFVSLLKQRPDAVVNLIQDWLNNSNNFYQQLGLRGLLPFINDPGFDNLPVFYRMIQPFMENAPGVLRPDLLDVLIALAHRSPQETAYFLKQCLHSEASIDAPWLVRQILLEFPPEIRDGLRQYVRKT
jgi:hypothetical protein